MSNTTQVKQITFSNILLKNAMNKAKKLGVSFPEYIRHLIINDTKQDEQEVYSLSEEEEKNIAKAMEEYNKGDYFETNSDAEIEALLDSWKNG